MPTANSAYLISQNALASINEKACLPKTGEKPNAVASTSLAQLQESLLKIHSCQKSLPVAFHVAVSASVLFVLLAIFSLTYAILLFFLKWPHLLLAAVSVIPALLFAPATGQVAGSMALRYITGLTSWQRRALAIHLPWYRAPRHWPLYLRNWLYSGDWLENCHENSESIYVRAFVTGQQPPDLQEELILWEHLLMPHVNGKRLEVRMAVWEMRWLEKLPEWTQNLIAGESLSDLERRLGAAATKWALSLLHRAASRIPEFIPADFSGDPHRAAFEFSYAVLPGGREGLLIIIRHRRVEEKAQVKKDLAA